MRIGGQTGDIDPERPLAGGTGGTVANLWQCRPLCCLRSFVQGPSEVATPIRVQLGLLMMIAWLMLCMSAGKLEQTVCWRECCNGGLNSGYRLHPP